MGLEKIMNTLKRIVHWQNVVSILLFAQFFLPVSAHAQEAEAVTVYAKGHGSLISTTDNRKIEAVLVVLRPDGTAVITLISDLQLRAEAQWSAKSSAQEVELKITGGELAGNASGSGKLVLTDDGKSIKELLIKAKSFDGRDLTLTFVSDSVDPLRAEHINLVSWPSLY